MRKDASPKKKQKFNGCSFVLNIEWKYSTIVFHLLWHTVELPWVLVYLLQWLIWFLCFRFDALTVLGAFKQTEFVCISVLRVASGPRVKLARRKSVLNPRLFILLTVLRRWTRCYSYILLLSGLCYEAICFKYCLVLFCYCIFSPFSIAITSLGEEKANLRAFRTFVRFALVWFCLFPLPLSVWDGLRLECGFSWTFLFRFSI